MSVFLSYCGNNFFEGYCNDIAVECKVDLLFIQFLFALLLYIFASLNLFAEEAELPPLLFIILL